MAAARGRPSLTERRRRQTRLEIAEAAAHLFAEKGYDETTVEDIASATGMSLRTFYRYCAAKEDALTPVLVSGISELVDRLADRPHDEPLTAAVPATFGTSMPEPRSADVDGARRLVRIMTTVPAVRMRWLAAGREMRDRLAHALVTRSAGATDDLEARLLAAALMEAISTATEHWAWQEEPDELGDLVRRAMTYLRIDELGRG
ncbi:helix-turn-helix domain-containing protein [Streptomyces sp. NPDC003077]|uniref:TetR/AcrR family transcriptional regulator n=1 Tax=Streptomyces sp. NPDC003077 TaxID=3154443 RepID=UPI0033B91C5C